MTKTTLTPELLMQDCNRCRAWETCAPGWCGPKHCKCGPEAPAPHPTLSRPLATDEEE